MILPRSWIKRMIFFVKCKKKVRFFFYGWMDGVLFGVWSDNVPTWTWWLVIDSFYGRSSMSKLNKLLIAQRFQQLLMWKQRNLAAGVQWQLTLILFRYKCPKQSYKVSPLGMMLNNKSDSTYRNLIFSENLFWKSESWVVVFESSIH